MPLSFSSCSRRAASSMRVSSSPHSSGTLSFISGEMTKTCSCINTRPSEALSTGPVAVSMVGTARP